ncbi:MAG: hypothetical protein ABSE87_07405 [Terracidiphilus sp.]
MRKLLSTIPLVLIFAGATMLFERPAYAYADPGTGLLAIQAVGSALVATGWYMRRKIYALLHRDAISKDQQGDCPTAEQDEGSSVR